MRGEDNSDIPAVEVDAFDKKVIYVYRHLDVASHEGWLKVGETLAHRITGEGKNLRILEQNTAANVAYEVLYTTDAVTNSGIGFSDEDIHRLLVAKGIEREDTINPATKRKSEWFKTDLKTIIDTIEEYKMEAVVQDDGVITEYTLRQEQKDAVQITENYLERCLEDASLEPSFLWNAKPRFGKTLTAYSFAAEMQAKKVLIVTNRPVIADSWYKDFKKFDFQDNNQEDGKFRWIFTSSEAVKRRLGNLKDILTRKQQTAKADLLAKNMVHFISLQDIKGRDLEGFKKKNGWIFELENWDLMIIDESHEGVDTSKTLKVFDRVRRKFTLHLSGTPFKALASSRFNNDQIYNWSYTDEQQAKENWPIADGKNPYADLPKMEIFTYQLSRILETTAEEAQNEGGGYAFDLTEFFRVIKVGDDERFAYEDKVKLFVKNLSNPEFQYPFSSEQMRESLRHTFWLLPGIKACEQMKRILLEDEYFGKYYSAEDIIMAAGDGDNDRAMNTALEEVRQRIGTAGSSRHPLETRTITLSCGQLTTGVTVPAWTAVLMLNNCKSPSLYMQAAFRAQNPFSIATSGGEYFTKQECYVFDFAPDRILQTVAEIASPVKTGVSATEREKKVKILLNFLPVVAEDDEGRMKYLNAHEVLTIPLKLATDEVINRGFMSNRLFKNIGNIFGCPKDIKDIINKLNVDKSDKDANKTQKVTLNMQPRVWADEKNQIHINDDIVIATTNGLFGDKQYVVLGSEDAEEVQNTLEEVTKQAQAAGYSLEVLRAVEKAVARRLPQIVLEDETGDLSKIKKEEPDDPPAKSEKSAEDLVREHLRGFARTIPSFLMAYGTPETTLANFGDNVPNDVFEELTNITKDEFKKLRDGVDYKIEDSGGKIKKMHFDGLFDEGVFNASVQEFNKKRTELADYYKDDASEDIFEYIPPQANNQIFTPRAVVKEMMEELAKVAPKIFESKESKFIDLYMKSGMFVTEVVKLLYNGTRRQYESDAECIKYILENQVYGLAPSTVLDAITKNYIFGFDKEQKISRRNFQEFDTTKSARLGTLEKKVKEIFNQGEDMKFTAVVGNPPYQETVGKTDTQTQSNSNWIYQYFQESADKLGNYTCLIYPFGGWFDAPKQLGGLGERILGDGHTISVDAYEGTSDRRAWYRNDRDPQPIFGNGANLSAGVSIVLRDMTKRHETFRFTNRIYTDVAAEVNIEELNSLVPNPAFLNISRKLTGEKLSRRLKKGMFGVESNFVERNPEKVSQKSSDWENPIRLLANDRSGSAGRTQLYWTDRKYIPRGEEYFDLTKVIMTSAYPKKSLVASTPTVESVKERAKQLIELLPTNSAFGASRLALFMSKSRQECENFLKYTQTDFFAALLLQEPNRRSTFGDVIPDQDFSQKSDIDWGESVEKVSEQLCRKYGLTREEKKFLGIR